MVPARPKYRQSSSQARAQGLSLVANGSVVRNELMEDFWVSAPGEAGKRKRKKRREEEENE